MRKQAHTGIRVTCWLPPDAIVCAKRTQEPSTVKNQHTKKAFIGLIADLLFLVSPLKKKNNLRTSPGGSEGKSGKDNVTYVQ